MAKRVINSGLSADVDNRPERGIFRVDTNAFSDPGLPDIEHQSVFGRPRSFLGIESRIPAAHDFDRLLRAGVSGRNAEA